MLYDLLSDHLDVFKALHAADVVHQDVGVGVADTSAAQVQPLLWRSGGEGKCVSVPTGQTGFHISSLTVCQRDALAVGPVCEIQGGHIMSLMVTTISLRSSCLIFKC